MEEATPARDARHRWPSAAQEERGGLSWHPFFFSLFASKKNVIIFSLSVRFQFYCTIKFLMVRSINKIHDAYVLTNFLYTDNLY